MTTQELDQHRRILGIIHVCMSVLSVLLVLGILVAAAVPLGLAASQPTRPQDEALLGGFSLIMLAVAGCFALVGLPGLLAGIGLLGRKRWARMATLIAGILCLPSFPLGTALGIYSIWFYTRPEAEQLLE